MTVVCDETGAFAVRALAGPGTLPRVIELFSQRAMMPRRVSAVLEGEEMRIDIGVEDVDVPLRDILVAKLSAMVAVTSVEFVEAPGRGQ